MQENDIIIDGDFILWKVVPTMKDSDDKTLDETLKLLDWYLINKIFIPTNTKSYIGFLGGKGNFRKDITDSYKADRTYEYPNYFKETKQYMIDKWKFISVDGIEAEDAVGITLTKYPNSVIICEDHDLLQLPGVQYNPTKEIFQDITTEIAYYNQWKQMLTGCSSDKVVGIPQVGEKKASKILEGCSKVQYKFFVLSEYVKYFGEYQGVEEFAKNYKLLKILRSLKGFEIPEFQKVERVEEPEIKTEF